MMKRWECPVHGATLTYGPGERRRFVKTMDEGVPSSGGCHSSSRYCTGHADWIEDAVLVEYVRVPAGAELLRPKTVADPWDDARVEWVVPVGADAPASPST